MNKGNRVRFFEETFLVANISLEVIFGMSFLTLSSTDIHFLDQELRGRIYTIEEALSSTGCIKLVGMKEFAIATLNPKYEIFVVHVASYSSTPLNVYPSRKSQISGLIAKKTSTRIPNKYVDFTNVFSLDLAFELFEQIGINDHAIELVDSQQLPCKSIYSLGPVELETLKTYIKSNLANKFIRLSKLPMSALILVNQKPNGFL